MPPYKRFGPKPVLGILVSTFVGVNKSPAPLPQCMAAASREIERGQLVKNVKTN